MSGTLDAGLWKYLGPVVPVVAQSDEDARYFDERVRAAQQARVYDVDKKIDWSDTYELILQGAREHLRRKPDHEYVLDIKKLERPKLKLVPGKYATLPYYTWADVLANKTRKPKTNVENAKRKRVFRKRKGWTNSFFFRK